MSTSPRGDLLEVVQDRDMNGSDPETSPSTLSSTTGIEAGSGQEAKLAEGRKDALDPFFLRKEQDRGRNLAGRGLGISGVDGSAVGAEEGGVNPRGGSAPRPPSQSFSPKRRSGSGSSGTGTSASRYQPHGHNYSHPGYEPEAERDGFLRDLYAFMAARGQPILKPPSLGFQELDLYRLYKTVLQRGGMDQVTKQQAWKSVYMDLDIPTMSTSASYNTRTNYKKYLYLYELEYFVPETQTSMSEEEDAATQDFAFLSEEYVRIESTVHDGAVFYGQILKRRRAQEDNQPVRQYYVHYNGWSSSHDEWMPEHALSHLLEHERPDPASLFNPPPTRSSKSNYLIYDPNVGPPPKSLHKKKLSSSKGGERTLSESSEGSHPEDRPTSPYLFKQKLPKKEARAGPRRDQDKQDSHGRQGDDHMDSDSYFLIKSLRKSKHASDGEVDRGCEGECEVEAPIMSVSLRTEPHRRRSMTMPATILSHGPDNKRHKRDWEYLSDSFYSTTEEEGEETHEPVAEDLGGGAVTLRHARTHVYDFQTEPNLPGQTESASRLRAHQTQQSSVSSPLLVAELAPLIGTDSVRPPASPSTQQQPLLTPHMSPPAPTPASGQKTSPSGKASDDESKVRTLKREKKETAGQTMQTEVRPMTASVGPGKDYPVITQYTMHQTFAVEPFHGYTQGPFKTNARPLAAPPSPPLTSAEDDDVALHPLDLVLPTEIIKQHATAASKRSRTRYSIKEDLENEAVQAALDAQVVADGQTYGEIKESLKRMEERMEAIRKEYRYYVNFLEESQRGNSSPTTTGAPGASNMKKEASTAAGSPPASIPVPPSPFKKNSKRTATAQ